MKANKERKNGWFEEYSCGCVSDIVKRRKDLLGYCGAHGSQRRGVFKVAKGRGFQVERTER